MSRHSLRCPQRDCTAVGVQGLPASRQWWLTETLRWLTQTTSLACVCVCVACCLIAHALAYDMRADIERCSVHVVGWQFNRRAPLPSAMLATSAPDPTLIRLPDALSAGSLRPSVEPPATPDCATPDTCGNAGPAQLHVTQHMLLCGIAVPARQRCVATDVVLAERDVAQALRRSSPAVSCGRGLRRVT